MNITTSNLGWGLLACLLAGGVLSGVQDWFTGQYEITRRGWRLRTTRRWYGPSAHVCLRAEEDNDEAERYTVIGWDDEGTDVPWLLVEAMDDDWTAHWAPVTDFAPYTVRRLRPHILRTEHHRFPMLFDYRPLRSPAGFLDGA
jgi:hypothetical protein